MFRERKNLSQAALSGDLDIATTTLYRIESGISWPVYENLTAIAARLGVTIEDFFADMDHKPIKPTPEEALEVLRDALASPKSDALTSEEQELLTNFRKLDPKLKGAVLNTAAGGSLPSEKARKKSTGA